MNSTIKVPDDIREIGRKYMYPKYGTDSQYILCMDNSRDRGYCKRTISRGFHAESCHKD